MQLYRLELPCADARRFQYGIKFWAAQAVALALIIPLSSRFAAIYDWAPFFVYLTVCICMSEKVNMLLPHCLPLPLPQQAE